MAFVSSAGLVGERLSADRLRNAILVDALLLCAAILAMILTARPLRLVFAELRDGTVQPAARRLRPRMVLVPQMVGAALGTFVVHAVLRRSGLSALQWMCECAPQLMNDAVATLGTLASVWACAPRRLRLHVLIMILAALLLYGATRQHWHVDRAPFSFAIGIQELVMARVIAVATGLLAFRRFHAG